MSMAHVLRVMKEVHTLPSSTKLALVAIADDASDDTGLSWPGLEKIQEWSDTSRRQALRIVANLEDAGFIEQVEQAHRGRRAVFRVTLDRGLEHAAGAAEWVSSGAPNDQGKGVIQGQERVSSSAERVSSRVGKGVIAVSPLSGYNSPEELSGEHSPNAREVRDSLFERCWTHWPRKDSKKKALDKFRRLNASQVMVVARAIVAHGDAYAQHDYGQFVPHLVTWLNGARWNDPIPPPRAGRAEYMDTARSIAEEIARRQQIREHNPAEIEEVPQ